MPEMITFATAYIFFFLTIFKNSYLAVHGLSWDVIATHSGKQTHSEGQCRQWSAVYHTGRPKAESPFSQGPRPTFVKTLYTLSVLLKPTSPNSLSLAWKVLKADTIRSQPWFMIRRVSWLYIVAYTNRCHNDYKGDGLRRELLHSFWGEGNGTPL